MIEAFKVGVTIALTNQISKGLGLIIRDLAKTDAQAIKLKKTLHGMEKLAIGGAITGGLGLALLKPINASLEAAKKYEQALNQFKAINLGDAVNRDADRFARGANVYGASATGLVGTLRDLHTVLNDYGLAKQLAPGFAQLKFANQAVFNGKGVDFNESQLRDLERIIELKGGFKNAAQFLGQANMMQQVIGSTGGMVLPRDYLNFSKTAGVAGRLLSDKSYYYGMEPLIQEMSGNRVGTALMSGHSQWAQGRMTQAAAMEMMRLGLLNKNNVEYTTIGTIKRVKPGALKGMDQFTADPFQWMKDVYLPALKAKGITSEKDVLKEIGATASNRTWSSLLSLMFLQQEKIEKAMGISQKAMGVDELVGLAKKSPQGAEAALGYAFENLKIAAGEVLLPIVIPAIVKLTESLQALGGWINRHPIRFQWLIYGFTALGAAMAFSGTVMLLRAGFLGLNAVIGVANGAGTLGAVGNFALALGKTGLAGALLAAAAATIIYHKEIADWIDSHDWGKKAGDALMSLRDNGAFRPTNFGTLAPGAWAVGKAAELIRGESSAPSVPPPPPPPPAPLSGTLRIQNDHLLVDFTTRGQTKAMNRPQASSNLFDTRMTPASVGATGTW